jgi:hypothetical protein
MVRGRIFTSIDSGLANGYTRIGFVISSPQERRTMARTVYDLTYEERALLLDWQHPIYQDVHRLYQVLDNAKHFKGVAAITPHYISFKEGGTQLIRDGRVESSNDYFPPTPRKHDRVNDDLPF